MCNKKLVMRDGVPTCPDCGYRDPRRVEGQSQPGYGSQQPQPNYGGQPQPDYGSQQPQLNYGGQSQPGYGSRQPQPNYGGQSQPNTGGQSALGPYAAVVHPENDTKKSNPAAIAAVSVVVFLLVFLVIGIFAYTFWSTSLRRDSGYLDSDTYGLSSAEADVQPSVETNYQEPSASSTGNHAGSISHLTFDPPESELLKEFVSRLFDKPAASATRDDLNSVVSLEVRDMPNGSGTEIVYELSDKTAGVCYLESSRVDTEDFICFPNLQRLDLGRNALDWGTDWHKLTSLTGLSCEASLKDLAGYMDVSQLKALELSCDFMMSDCSGIEEYSSLEYLKLDCSDHGMELTGLSRGASLKALVIEDGNGISDFEELYDMPQLKELSIDSDGLRDIGFISAMSGLEELVLCNTELLQIDAVADCRDTLKCLRLHKNYSLKDYSPVFLCTGLEELELYVYYDHNMEMVMPDLSMMPGLKTLILGNYEKFPGLKDLTSLENLILEDAGYFDNGAELAGMENLTGLKTLSLINMSMDPALLEAFAGVESLEAIDLTDSYIWGDINAAFGMPGLRTLNLENADFGLMLEGMPVSESLQELNMDGANVHQLAEDGSWDYRADNTRIRLGDHTEFFAHMPGLTVLSVPDQNLQDVEFAKGLTQLERLDITNNYVTDLSPLAAVRGLKVIFCENNPVNDRTGLKNVIIID